MYCLLRIFCEFFGNCSQITTYCEFPHISLLYFILQIGPCCLGSLGHHSLTSNLRNAFMTSFEKSV